MISRWIGIIYVIHKQILYTFIYWQICSSCPQTEAVFLQMVPQTGCPIRCKVTLVAFFWLSPLCVFKCLLKLLGSEQAYSHWLHFLVFSPLCFQMSPQTVCPRGCIITLVAFVWLFSTVFLKMVPQSACPNGCIVALVAFVWLFSTVFLQMVPERMLL